MTYRLTVKDYRPRKRGPRHVVPAVSELDFETRYQRTHYVAAVLRTVPSSVYDGAAQLLTVRDPSHVAAA